LHFGKLYCYTNRMEEYYNIAKAYFRGTISAADEKRLSEWLKEDKHALLFRIWKEEWHQQAKAQASEKTKAAWEKLKAKQSTIDNQQSTTIRPLRRYYYAAAASVLLLFGVALWLIIPSKQEPFMAQTGAHEQQSFVLPDGTEVTMNIKSTLACAADFGKADRQISFDGEAVFHVAKDADKPFVINVGDYSVTVLGTVFNLSAYTTDDAYTVTLLEGAVKVKYASDSVIMKPLDEVRFDKETESFELQQVQIAKADTWINGRLEFDNIELGDLAHKLEREYDVQIAFADEAIKAEKVYISISIEDNFADVCAALETLLPIRISQENDHYLISAQ